jgi:hypothetical protein
MPRRDPIYAELQRLEEQASAELQRVFRKQRGLLEIHTLGTAIAKIRAKKLYGKPWARDVNELVNRLMPKATCAEMYKKAQQIVTEAVIRGGAIGAQKIKGAFK